jgi:transcriptional regulator with XRE-family HTH domain
MHWSADITCEQIRAARAYLGWSQTELAERSGLTRKTIYEMEKGAYVRDANHSAVINVLEDAGITFVSAEGKTGILGAEQIRNEVG